MLNDKRIRIVTGHYGSGKTEFSTNYACLLARQTSSPVAIVDLDTVNPYFTSREQRVKLEHQGVTVIAQPMQWTSIDLPSQPPEIQGILSNQAYHVIIDVGGDAAGAKVLGSFHRILSQQSYDLFLVVNANRPFTKHVDQVMDYIQQIENACRLKVTKLVNNTHLIHDTTEEDLRRGDLLVKEVSQKTNLPISYILGKKEVKANSNDYAGTYLPIDLFVRPKWL